MASRSPDIRRVDTGSSMSTSTSQLALGLKVEDDKEGGEDEETIESLMNRLAIERRVQYGAEKMLDVIEKRSGEADSGDSEQVKERITTQLEAANERIKALEARLERAERLKGSSSSTPSRNRRRPQPRLNGYPSSSSLGLGQSMSSQNALLGTSPRPRYQRQNSNLTPDLLSQSQFPSVSNFGSPPASRFPKSLSPSRPRSRSIGEDAYGDYSFGGESSYSGLSWGGAPSQSEISSPGGVDDERLMRKVEEMTASVRQLRECAPRASNEVEGKGKGREIARADEDKAWEGLSRMATIFKRSPGLRNHLNMDLVVTSIVPFLGDDSSTILRAASYRVLRLAVDRMVWGTIVAAGLEWFIVRSFTRDAKAQQEKEQALRLLRTIIALPPPPPDYLRQRSRRGTTNSRPGSSRHPTPSGRNSNRHSRQASANVEVDPIDALLARTIPLTDGMVRAIVSLAENPDDPLRMVCLETLVEIALLDIDCLVRSDAFRVLLLVFKDGPVELGPPITTALLHLVDKPSSRQYLIPGSDLETVLVGLTEEYGKVPSRLRDRHLAKLQTCLGNIAMLLASWPGVLYMCMDECRAFKSLLSCLQAPTSEVKAIALDLLFSVLRIKSPPWLEAFLEGKRLTVYNRTKEATSALQDRTYNDEPPPNLNLADHFIGFLLLALIKSGLVESLISVIEHSPSGVGRKATLLLGEVLQMARRLLPMEYAAELQSLPRLFDGVMKMSDSSERQFALSALSSIDSLNRNHNRAFQRAAKTKAGTAEDSLERGKRQVEQVKLRQILQIDDKQFQAMINDTGVLLGRDHTKWNYEIIMDLIEGPLLNPKRLDEAIKATKFVRRLFSFFHPANNHFSSIKRTRPNHKWVKLGCSLLSTMLINPEGIRFVTEDKLLPQLTDCFNELDQYVGVPSIQPVLARNRVESTLTYGYFEMIGTLSKHTEGIKLLERFKLFTSFYHLSEQRGRDDLMRIIIDCFDYTKEAHPRIVLAKALTSAYMETRLFATHHLARLLQEQPALTDWALQLMITQLYDTSIEVCEVAVMYLEELCSNPVTLEKVVQFRPTLEHLDDLGQQLFMRFVSTSAGFGYLHRAGYIERELEVWLEECNLLYVVEAETFVTRTLSTSTLAEDDWSFEGTAPPHFLGELTKTPEGCQMLRDRGIVTEMAELIRLHGTETNDQGLIMNVKSALWALANIGSTDGGLPFLEDEEIIDVIVDIAESCPILSTKGTAFFVIGLLSRSHPGSQIMDEYGWISAPTPLGETTGLCYPNDVSRFAQIDPWTRVEADPPPQAWGTLSETELEIMSNIAKLANYVLASGAMNRLKKLRVREPEHFSSLHMFHRAGRMISTNHYQAPVRRFILDLFNVPIDSETVEELAHLDVRTLQRYENHRASSSRSHPYAPQRTRDRAANEPNGTEQGYFDGDAESHEHRRRSASSPGPPPPGRTQRDRGLTISEIRSRREEGVLSRRESGSGISGVQG